MSDAPKSTIAFALRKLMTALDDATYPYYENLPLEAAMIELGIVFRTEKEE